MLDELLEALKKIWLAKGIGINNGATKTELDSFENKFHVKIPQDMRGYFATLNGMQIGYYDGATRLWSLEEVRPLTDYLAPTAGFSIPPVMHHSISNVPDRLWAGWHRLMEPTSLDQVEPSHNSVRLLLPDAEHYFLFGDYLYEGSVWVIHLSDSLEADNSILSVYDFPGQYHRVADNVKGFLAQYIAESPDTLI